MGDDRQAAGNAPVVKANCEGRAKDRTVRSFTGDCERAYVEARGRKGRSEPSGRDQRDLIASPFQIEAGLDRDLLGEPIRPGMGRAGRPIHLPTEASRARVLQLAGDGVTQDRIAAEIGISMPTLRLNYAAELRSRSTTWRRRAAAQGD